ncbi:MAG: glycoside hydrolase family 28 protein [Bacteroidales bacterium]|nr:glycoside hydrolase family 28 protein [Bacteroidales bacterium]
MDKVAEPVFPDYSVEITAYGAIPGGQVLNTKAFAEAIAHVSEKGGGKVVVPRGIWLTGPVEMKSNVNLHVAEGALVIFSKNFDDYPLIKTSFEGLETYRCISPIYGIDLENVAITGKGIIDGSGDAWRPVKKSKLTESQWKKLIASGGVLNKNGNSWYPSEKALRGIEGSDMNVPRGRKTREDFMEIKDFLRPVMVSLVKCKNVLLDGPTFQNSPAWNLHPLMCENVILRNLTVKNPWYSQNGDGLDLESCKNALVYNCNFDVGDDAICFKSGKDSTGRARAMPTENVIVKECVVYHGHGGFVVGSEMSGGVRNVHVSNCTFIGTDVGIRFKSTRGRGGVVENIYISNINMIDIPTEPIHFNLYYGGNSPVPEPDEPIVVQNKSVIPPVSEKTPQFKNIYMKNIVCKGAARAAILQGLPEMNIQNIQIEDAVLEAERGIEFFDADNVTLKNVTVIPAKGLAVFIYNSKNININGLTADTDAERLVRVTGDLSNSIVFENTEFGPDRMILDDNVAKNAVQFK